MRAFVYRVFYYTGLRHNELNGLTLADFKLDIAEPAIRIPPSLAKNRRFNLVEIAAALMSDLRTFLATFKNRTDRPFYGLIPKIETLKKDLDRAGLPFENEDGRFDLHAFRKTLGTHLALAGEPLQKVQRILRHETLSMTMKFYTDVSLIKSRESFAKLPALKGKKETPQLPKAETPVGGTVKMDFPVPSVTRNVKSGYVNDKSQSLDDESLGREMALVGATENDLSDPSSNLSSPTISPPVPTGARTSSEGSFSRGCGICSSYPALSQCVSKGPEMPVCAEPPEVSSTPAFFFTSTGSFAKDSLPPIRETSV
jgi:hypothetical protein